MRAYFLSTHGRPHACLGPFWAWLAGAAWAGDRLTWQPAEGICSGEAAAQLKRGACGGGDSSCGALTNGAAGVPAGHRAGIGKRPVPMRVASARHDCLGSVLGLKQEVSWPGRHEGSRRRAGAHV